MMFEHIIDTHAVEADEPTRVRGVALLEGEVSFEKEKIVRKKTYPIFGLDIEGYEIHNGITDSLSRDKEKFYGTFVHGLFDNDAFRQKLFSEVNPGYRGFDFQAYKKRSVVSFASHGEEHMDMHRLLKALHE